MGTLENLRGCERSVAKPPGHQKSVPCRLCLWSGDKEDLKTDKERNWVAVHRKRQCLNNLPLLFSIGTINTILKCYRNLMSLF